MRAQYLAMCASAAPGLFRDEWHLRYHYPQERGWCYVHMQMLANGTATIWPRREDNAAGRWWNRLMEWWRSRK